LSQGRLKIFIILGAFLLGNDFKSNAPKGAPKAGTPRLKNTRTPHDLTSLFWLMHLVTFIIIK
jgi:hypothetical protein